MQTKKDLIPIDEVIRRYDGGTGETLEQITRDLRTRGVMVSQALVTKVMREAGVNLTQRGGTPVIEIAGLVEYGRRYADGERLEDLAWEAEVSLDTLRKRLEKAGYKTTPCTSKTSLRKIDTVDEEYAVATYEASHDGMVLGTITKYDASAWKQTKKGARYLRLISWRHSLSIPSEQKTRTDCIKDLESKAGVNS